ncbi:hypothetical protein HFP89_01880 [Wenzhouxiangella sp. XN79A]|uniref:hypothetical protein n=1 Tax=Wenzhouxiangella sp. XN79A TaxID=2724193 RepID=UPI00144AEBCB|nr:hypothetical protein [Wenzhouxiangella sp. XN79A]NKI33913.1 hypothetical protein [Wenzhouxiangella sp. XN79A]
MTDRNSPGKHGKHKSRFAKSSADLWMVMVVGTTTIFIIAVDWLGASLLHTFFGPRDERLLLEPLTVTVERTDAVIQRWSMTALGLSATIVALFVLAWVLSTWVQGRDRKRKQRDSADATPTLNAWKKLWLSLALLIFAITLGWSSAGLEQWLMGDHGSLQHLSDRFSIAVSALFIGVLVGALGISIKNRRKPWRYWLVMSLSAIGIVLVATSWFTSVHIPPASVLLFLALSWGYLLFQLVWSYAIPQNFSSDEKPPPRRHLICFISDQVASKPFERGYAFDKFEDHVQARFDGHADIAEALIRAFREWTSHSSMPEDTPELPADFADALVIVLYALQQELSEGFAQQGSEPLQSVFLRLHKRLDKSSLDDEKTSLNDLKSSSNLELELLAVHLLGEVWRMHRQPVGRNSMLSDLIKAYQTLTGIRAKWLMPVISAEHNLGLGTEASSRSLNSPTMQEMTCVFSESQTKDGKRSGSFEAIEQFAWLFEVLFRRYYGLQSDLPLFSVFLPELERRRPAELVRLDDAIRQPGALGIDFLDYEQCSQAIVDIIRHLSEHPEDEIAIDFTGGLKPTTMAAVFATTFSHATSQYVDTNEFTVYGFDMRYHDIRFLIS